jgi:hypothetical protein
MALECLVPFLDASTFQSLHHAGLEDIDFGVNEDMLLLGAKFDLEPCDLLKVVHDTKNKLSRDKVIELLNAGVINIDYISDFDRLCDLGFTITELLILVNASIPVKNIVVYDLIQLYNGLGFTSKFKIEHLIKNNAYPENVYPYIQTGIMSEDNWHEIPIYIKYGISPIHAVPFFAIGFKSPFGISVCLDAHISPEQVSPYLEAGYRHSFICSCIEGYIKYCVSPTDAVNFSAINVPLGIQIFEYQNSGLDIEQISPFTMQRSKCFVASSVIKFIKNGLTVDDVFSFNSIEISFNDPQVMSDYKRYDISIEQISSFIAIGYSLTSSAIIIKFIKNEICADEVASFQAIKIDKFEDMIKYKNAGISAKIVSSFVEIGYSPFDTTIIKFIKNGIFADEVASFQAIKIDKFEDIIKYKNASISVKIVSSFVEIGYSPFDTTIIKFIKNGIFADEVASFQAIKIDKFEDIIKHKNAGISAKMIASFVEIGYSPFGLSITKFIKNGIFADEVAFFKAVGIKTFAEMVSFKNAGISAKMISSFVEIGYSPFDSSIIKFIKNRKTAIEILRTNQIIFSLIVMFLVSICFWYFIFYDF